MTALTFIITPISIIAIAIHNRYSPRAVGQNEHSPHRRGDNTHCCISILQEAIHFSKSESERLRNQGPLHHLPLFSHTIFSFCTDFPFPILLRLLTQQRNNKSQSHLNPSCHRSVSALVIPAAFNSTANQHKRDICFRLTNPAGRSARRRYRP